MTTLPGWMPSWMKRRALLLAGYLKLANTVRRRPLTWVAVGVAAVVACWLAARPESAHLLRAAADHAAVVFVLAVIQASMSVSRRKQRVCAEIEYSWVSPLPFQVWAPVRLAFAPVVQVLVVALLLAVVVLGSDATLNEAGSVLLAVVVGFAVGGTVGWFFMPRFKTPVAGSQYAVVRQVRDHWAGAPKLEPLSYWAVAHARVMNNPRVTANTMIIVLLAVPMGTPGEVAIAAAAGWMVGLHLVLTLLATMRTASPAGWWLGATPVRVGRFAVALSWRAVASQAVACAVVAFVAAALAPPRMASLAWELPSLWIAFAVTLSVLAGYRGLK